MCWFSYCFKNFEKKINKTLNFRAFTNSNFGMSCLIFHFSNDFKSLLKRNKKTV